MNNTFYGNIGFSNRRTALTQEAETILSAINKFRCMRIDQVPYFMPTTKSQKEDYHKVICTHLSIKKFANISGEYVFAINENIISQEMIDSIWVAADMLLQAKVSNTGDKLKNAFKAQFPCTISFIQNNTCLIKTLPLLTPDDIVKVISENDRYTANTDDELRKENEQKLLYVISIRDTSLLSEIERISPVFPHKIAYLEGDYNSKPNITYYSK